MARYIQSVERATRVLTVLSESSKLMGVTEIARKVDLKKSTVHRILASLKRARLVRSDLKSRQYSLGFGLLQLTSDWLNKSELSRLSQPYLRELREITGETITLNIRDNNSRVAIERFDTSHEIRYVVEIGRSLPLYIGAGGKSILAFMPGDEILDVLQSSGFDKKRLSLLHEELLEIRRTGSAYTLGERLPGAGSISAPIFNHSNIVIGSVSVLCLESRLSEKVIREFRKSAKETATHISREFGSWAETTNRKLVKSR